MCGRFTLRVPANVLVDEFGLAAAPALTPRYNIAPTQNTPVIRADAATGQRRCDLMRWGLVPSWADDPAIGNRMINARSETVAVKPAYRSAFQKRRCLVPADGYYEWRVMDGGKQPYLFHREDDRPFVFAGLWESWQAPDGSPLETFVIITTDANEQTLPYHDRMPVVLHGLALDLWLQPQAQRDQLLDLLRPRPLEQLVIDPVSKLVNNPRHDRPECVERLQSPGAPSQPSDEQSF